VVDGRALAERCPRCNGEHELLEHAAVTVNGVRLREARLRCRACRSVRSLFFQLEEALPN
jgi:transposase-like protein